MSKRYKIANKTGVYGLNSDRRKVAGRPDVCYYINYKIDGKTTWEKVGWKSEGYSSQLAAELRGERMKNIRHGQTVKTAKEIKREQRRKDKTLDEIKTEYFGSTRGQNLKGRVTDLNRYKNYLGPVLGNRPISTLAPLDIERVKTAMKGKAPGTIRNTLELLRRLTNFGARNGLCAPLGFKIKLPKVDNERTEYLTPEEAARLVNVLDSWPRPDIARMLKLAMLSGMRRGEIFKLKIEDVDFEKKLIFLRDPKGGKDVSIPLSRPVERLLKDQITWALDYHPGTSYVFPGKNGNRRVDSSGVERIKKAAELPAKFRIFHGLRHHFAVTLANSGDFTLDMIGELLTHKDSIVTRRYAQFLPDTKQKASEEAAKLIQAMAAGPVSIERGKDHVF